MKNVLLKIAVCTALITGGCRKETHDEKVTLTFKDRRMESFQPLGNNTTFENSVVLKSQGNFTGHQFLFSDFDGDGHTDLVAVLPQSGRAIVWRSSGDGGLDINARHTVWMDNQGDYTGYEFMAADMNADGRSDLLAISPLHGRAVVWTSSGNSLIVPPGNPAWMEAQGNYSGYQFITADMTGEGRSDLVAVSPQSGKAVVWTSSGTGLSAAAGNPVWMENQGNYNGYEFLATDMTGDGKADLLAIAPQYGRAVVWPSSGSALIIPPGNPAWMENQGDYSGYKFLAADMTGDGRADLLAVSPQHGRTVVWQSNGASLIIPSGNPAWTEAQGDFSGYTFSTAINGKHRNGSNRTDLFATDPSNARTVAWSVKENIHPATISRVSGANWNNDDAQWPFLVYLQGSNKLVMQLLTFTDIIGESLINARTVLINSTDNGYTWGPRSDFPLTSDAIGLTNSGNGTLYSFKENVLSGFYKSVDNGITWQATLNQTPPAMATLSTWDPALVVNHNGTEKILQMGYVGNGSFGTAQYYSLPYIRSSFDGGQTWSSPQQIVQFTGYCEVNMAVAANGDIVAACRRDPSMDFREGHETEFDNYGGLSVSISKDQGQSWSTPKRLFDFGRHHPSLLLLNDGQTILMTYAVRVGGTLGAGDNFADSADGYPNFGIEAIESHDNGVTWDVAHRYILSKWKGNVRTDQPNYFFRAPQSTSTVQLADGSLLTAYGTGRYRTASSGKADWFMDIDLIRWNR